MDELPEAFMKEQAAFWLNSTLSQFGKEVMELARQGVEAYGEPVALHFNEMFGVWRQSRNAFEDGEYAQALRLAQATQGAIGEIEEMKSRYPYRDRTKEEATLGGR
jgi:hypothetical protein